MSFANPKGIVSLSLLKPKVGAHAPTLGQRENGNNRNAVAANIAHNRRKNGHNRERAPV